MTRDEILAVLRWPAKAGNGLVPWYVIARRAPGGVLIYCGLAIAWLGVLLANGYSQARHFWRRATT